MTSVRNIYILRDTEFIIGLGKELEAVVKGSRVPIAI